jgi:hypothetical protein
MEARDPLLGRPLKKGRKWTEEEAGEELSGAIIVGLEGGVREQSWSVELSS